MRPASKAKRSWKERPIPTYGESNAKVIMTYLGTFINEVVSRRERGVPKNALVIKVLNCIVYLFGKLFTFFHNSRSIQRALIFS